jgi:hypothetical protein
LENSGTSDFSLTQPKSPPLGAEPASFDFALAMSSKFPPAFSCAMIAFASDSFLYQDMFNMVFLASVLIFDRIVSSPEFCFR